MITLNIKEAYAYLEAETILADSMLLDFQALKLAVKRKMLFQIGDLELFTLPTFTNHWGTYQIDKVYKVEEEKIKANLLIHPYRVKAHIIEPSPAFSKLEGIIKQGLVKVDQAFTGYEDYSYIDEALKEMFKGIAKKVG